MQKLKNANLYRSELIPVSGKLVERYNQCLRTLGFKATALKSFNIDAIGWSPEIAEEKGLTHYLNHGDANLHGIIISPLQKSKPIYAAFHTFDKEMIQQIFKTYEAKIQDITRNTAICIDFDQGIDTFYNPLDVLKYNSITIRFKLVGNLDKAQEEQLKLVKLFYDADNFINENIHNKLLKSAKQYGDLRHRKLHLDPIFFKTNSFFTKAFGGVYVLRDFISPILIFENHTAYKEAIKDSVHEVLMYHISQPELIAKLKDHLILDINLKEDVNTARYNRIKHYYFQKYIIQPEHPIKDILSNTVLFKRYLNTLDLATIKKINAVEIYLEHLKTSDKLKAEDFIDLSFYFALHRPHSSLNVQHQDLIWRLLVSVAPQDVLFLYWYNRDVFYEYYKTYNESLKDWVIEVITKKVYLKQ